jgi:hypothetical protein
VIDWATGTGDGGFAANFVGAITNILGGGNGSGVVTNFVDSSGATNGPARYYRVRVQIP